MIFLHPDHKKLFDALSSQFQLSEKQQGQLQQYIDLLLTYNQKFNLTAVTKIEDVISYHLEDALALTKHITMSGARAIADVGSGGGVPGIPLAILYPDVPIYLIEVQQKKITFLQHVIDELALVGGTVYPYDWRTFLRETSYPIDIICARASLQPEELVRMFKPSSAYKDGLLIYWASKSWQAGERELPYVCDTYAYHVGQRDRACVFFSSDGKQRTFALTKGA